MIGKGPLVTIGIPTFNRANLLSRAIESALNQDYENIELLISDNASTDATESICQAYASVDPRLKYFKQAKNMGMGFNFYHVLKNASGSFFMWLGDDDWIDSNYISATLQAFEEDQTVTLASGVPRYYVNGEKVNDGKVFKVLYKIWWRRILSYYWQVTDNGMIYGLMRTQHILQLHFAELWGGDRIIVARLASFGKIVILEETSVHREWGVSRRSWLLAKSCGFPTIQGVFPYTTLAINALVDIIRSDSSYKIFPSIQRLLIGVTVFLIILLKAITIYATSFIRLSKRLLIRYFIAMRFD